MATTTLPFSAGEHIGDSDIEVSNRDLASTLSSPLKEVAESNPCLLEYLQLLSSCGITMPSYHPELTRQMGDNKEPNLIYPTTHEGTFVHILVNPEDNRNSYIPIEPATTLNLDSLMYNVETKLLELRARLVRIDTDKDKTQQYLEYIEQVTTVSDRFGPTFLNNYIGFLRKGGIPLVKVRITKRELEGIKYLFIRDKVGLDILDPLINDPFIEDISCSGLGQIFVEHKIFKSLKSTISFTSLEELDRFITRLAEKIRKPVNYRKPIADAALPDGSRINIVFGDEISKRGSNFTIRKFSEVPISIFELVEFGTINYHMLAYLSLVIGNELSLFVSGETASGKTTMLNAITTFIPPLAKIVTIEDTPELQVPHKNWIREVVQSTKVEDTGGAVTMYDLLKAALRQRPNQIIIGEIRGPEGNVAFQAMQTGHAVMATFHAASVEKLIQRMTGSPILVPKTYVDNLNVVILMSMVKLPNGKMGRRVTGIAELVNYDPVFDSFTFAESFHWDEATDTFEFTGNMCSYILERKIAPKKGIKSHEKRRIYAEVERRAKILAKLHREHKITGFYEILQALAQAQQEGLF